MANADELDEVEALRAEVARRHRALIRGLVAAGAVLLVAALIVWALLDLERRPGLLVVPVGLAGFGLAAIARGMYSALSDVDTRPDKDLVGVEDEAGGEGDDGGGSEAR